MRRTSAAWVSTVSARDSASSRTRLANSAFLLGESSHLISSASACSAAFLGHHQNTSPSTPSSVATIVNTRPIVLLTSSHSRSRQVAGSRTTPHNRTRTFPGRRGRYDEGIGVSSMPAAQRRWKLACHRTTGKLTSKIGMPTETSTSPKPAIVTMNSTSPKQASTRSVTAHPSSISRLLTSFATNTS
jgi:hypothetical protein